MRDRWGDITANCGKVSWISGLLFPIVHPSIRACALIRAAASSKGASYWLWRNLLLMLHGIDIGRGAIIGNGLVLPHPANIVIGRGVIIGSNVTIFHGVTLGAKDSLYPKLEDNVVVYPGATIIGPVTIGQKAIVGPSTVLFQDLPPESRAVVGQSRILE